MNGLEPLAKIIMSQKPDQLDVIVQRYTSTEISNSEALEGARHIIAEWINERSSVRNRVRWHLDKFARIQTKVVKAKADHEKALKFKDYFNFYLTFNTVTINSFNVGSLRKPLFYWLCYLIRKWFLKSSSYVFKGFLPLF